MRIPLIDRIFKRRNGKHDAEEAAHQKRVEAENVKARAARRRLQEIEREHAEEKAEQQAVTDTMFDRVKKRSTEMGSGVFNPPDGKTAAEVAAEENDRTQTAEGTA